MTKSRNIAVFFFGALLAAVVWTSVWPEERQADAETLLATRASVREPVPGKREIAAWLAELESAPDAAARAALAGRLNRIPGSEFPDVLDDVELIRNWSLTLPARLLLSRWAAVDGEAAVNWAWLRLGTDSQWDRAFLEMVESWAWHRPRELADWTRHRKSENPSLGHMNLAELETVGEPVLEFGHLGKIFQALVKAEPRLAFEILQLRGGHSSEDSRLIKSLHTVAGVREALLAFDCLDEMEPFKFSGNAQIFANGLLHRWKEIDPEDFAVSPYAHLVPGPEAFPKPDLSHLPPAVLQQREWVGEFDRWSRDELAERPDMSGWSAAKREAWEDLEALRGGP